MPVSFPSYMSTWKTRVDLAQQCPMKELGLALFCGCAVRASVPRDLPEFTQAGCTQLSQLSLQHLACCKAFPGCGEGWNVGPFLLLLCPSWECVQVLQAPGKHSTGQSELCFLRCFLLLMLKPTAASSQVNGWQKILLVVFGFLCIFFYCYFLKSVCCFVFWNKQGVPSSDGTTCRKYLTMEL